MGAAILHGVHIGHYRTQMDIALFSYAVYNSRHFHRCATDTLSYHSSSHLFGALRTRGEEKEEADAW